jgi:SNF2 family DNA or RNA helicase
LTLVSYQGVANMFPDIVNFLKKYKVMVVLDEAHKIKNIEGGIIAGVILRLAQYCKSRVILTGTPVPNGYEDLYNLFKFIWPNKNVIKYHPFQLKDMTQNNNDKRIPELINQISPYFVRIRKSDLGLPKPIENEPIVVKMGNHQAEIYNYIENKYMDFFKAHMGGANLNSMFSKARLVRLMQASTNPALLKKPIDLYFQELGIGNETFIDDSDIIDKILKYETLEIPQKFLAAGELVKSLIEKNSKVVVWSIFIQNIHDFSAYLASIGIESRKLYGATPIERDDNGDMSDIDNETREGIIREFHNPSSAFKVIIANPFAISESISLHKASHNAIYLERSFNAANFIQSKDRIHRYGLKKDDQINYFYILSDNNIDFTIHQRLIEKERRMMDIIEKESIPLFKILEETNEGDLRALIDNYVKRTKRL